MGIIGNNGAGKSTLLKLLIRLIKPSQGKITVDGITLSKMPSKALASKFGLVFQNPAIQFYKDTVEQEIGEILSRYKKFLSVTPDIPEILTSYNLLQYRTIYPRYLSEGEQQRLAIAMVLCRSPAIILLDEPTHGMDTIQKKNLYDILHKFRQKGHIIIIATHDIKSIASHANKVILLENGSVKDIGDPHDVLSSNVEFRPQLSRFIKDYLNTDSKIINYAEMKEVIKNA